MVPCHNEEHAIGSTLTRLISALSDCEPYEIIIVDDGSTDSSAEALASWVKRLPHLSVIAHERNRGYGAAIKTGISMARASLIVITDADGTYPLEEIPRLIEACKSADMVVAARTGDDVIYPWIRKLPKTFLTRYASWIVGRNIPDLNSGLRVFRKELAVRFSRILPDGFSLTTTLTLAAMTNLMSVKFLPIDYSVRIGRSKIRPIRDTLNFVQLIIRTGLYFAPLRVFSPIIVASFVATILAFCYDVYYLGNLTDKSLLLLTFSLNIGAVALLADMIDKRSPR